MSFKCQSCKVPQEPRTKATRIVVERYGVQNEFERVGQIKREESWCPSCVERRKAA